MYNYINADDATDNINRNWRYDTRLEAPKDGELRLYDVRSQYILESYIIV